MARLEALYNAILDGDAKKAHAATQDAIDAGIAPMDAADVADFYGRNPVTWCLGRGYIRLPLAAAPVLSRARGGIAQPD